MLNVERLMASELVALSTHEVIGAALLLWCRSWKQRPAASLPDDDRVLAAFARLPLPRFRKLRDEVLRGFVKCSDGRLYHPVMAAEAINAYAKKQSFRKKRETDAERLRKWREEQRGTQAETSVETKDETRFVAEGQGQGQGQGQSPVVPIRDEAFETAWSAFPAQRKGARDKALVAWRSAFRRHSGLEADAIIAAIRDYAGSDEVARGFAKGMAAWLNDDRWTVTYAAPGPGGKPTPKRPQADDWAKDIDLG